MNQNLSTSTMLAAHSEQPTILRQASQGQRLLTFVIDYCCFFFCWFVFGLVLAILGMSDIIEKISDFLLGMTIMSIYYIPHEALFGRTVGKLITGTKVVSHDGSQISFWQVLGRTLCRFIPFDALSFLGNSGVPLGWHDRIPKTMVISTRRT